MLNLEFIKLTTPTEEIAECFSKWENDPALIPFVRPNPDKETLMRRKPVTVDDLVQRLERYHIYLIYLGGQLIGDVNYQIDPAYLYRKETGTAWIGIMIGEEASRGKGVGYQALSYLEQEIKLQGLKRIELGVFEFNTNAIKLYEKCGFKEIGRIKDFTYWQDRMWQDIRMEKYIQP